MADNPSYYGQVREFNSQNTDWVIYKRRLDNYFVVNAISEDAKKRAILLNALDEESYKLIHNLCLPRFPEDKTYKELSDLFNKHFKVVESPFVARSKFFAACKNANESVNEWAARVRCLASNCEFQENTIDVMLRDRFIIGFEKGPVQAKLFKEKISCSFSDVIESAMVEMAAGEVSVSKNSFLKMEPGVHHVTSSRATSSVRKPRDVSEMCKCCGRKNHPTTKCRYRQYVCNLCHVKGHLAPMCPAKEKELRIGKNNPRYKQKNVQNFIESSDVFAINEVRNVENPFILEIKIDNKNYSFQLDSGASISAMSEEFWKKNFSKYVLAPVNKMLNVYNGETMCTLGMCKLKIFYNG